MQHRIRKSAVKKCMEQMGYTNNHKNVELTTDPPANLLIDEVQQIFGNFGKILNLTLTQTGATISFSKASSAFMAVQTLHGQTINETVLSVVYQQPEERPLITDFFSHGDVFVPTQQLDNTGKLSVDPPQIKKYICVFPIVPQDDSDFRIYERIKGVQGCNLLKIIELVSREFQIPPRPQDLIKIKLDRDSRCVKITSRYLDRYEHAVDLVYNLFTNLYEEYKRYCEKADIAPPVLLVKSMETVRGYSAEFR